MKYAILSDIHSNLTALEAVLVDIEKHGGADEFWCLGDIVGYGPDPHECLDIVRSRFSLCVAGNHDLAVTGKLNISGFNPDAIKAVNWHSHHLSQIELRFLSSLPQIIEKEDFTLVHGSPREPVWEYVLSREQAEDNLPFFNTRNCLTGHSHIPQYYICTEKCEAGSSADGTSIKLKEGRFIINPGGVGQPRDRDSRSAYAIYDSLTTTLVFKRVSYDITAVQARMEKQGSPSWLVKRLSFGL